MKRIVTFITLCVVMIYASLGFASDTCDPAKARLKSEIAKVTFSVEVVDTEETRAKGLMFRETLPKFSGMLFVYDTPQPVRFWMLNTLIPLDMIFMDQTGRVTKVHANAVPLDETAIFGGDQVFAVLEINGGLAEHLRIASGAVVQHPAFPAKTAAWPCGE